MKKICVLLFASLLSAGLLPVSANDLRIYFGTRHNQTFTSNEFESRKLRTYLILDQTTNQFTFVTYNDRMHSETVFEIDARSIVPNSPELTKASRQFIYSSDSDGGTPVNTFRFRSTAKPVNLPISSSSAELTSRTLTYSGWFYALAAYNFEETATFNYQKRLTIEANDASKDLPGAVNLVLDDLRRRNLID